MDATVDNFISTHLTARPRLLIVSTVVNTLQSFLLPYAQHFRSLGWRVDGAAAGVAGSVRCKDAFNHVYEMAWSRSLRHVRHMSRAVQAIQNMAYSGQYDLVHVHTPIAAFLTRYALRGVHGGNPVQVIYTAHGFHFYQGGDLLRNSAYRALEQVAGRWTDFLVVINHEDEEAARRYHLVPNDRIFYMPGIGVDTERLDPARVDACAVANVRAELGLTDADHLFLMIAEFNPGKRHQDLIEAFALVSRLDIHLALAGVGPQLELMKKLAGELGVASRVHFLGFRTDIPVLTRAAIATVLPSQREGLPRSMMESLALGVPVVGADTRGIRDLLAPGAGLIVPVGDVGRLAAALLWMADHAEGREAMGRLGRRQMQGYNTEHIIAMHEQLYGQALARQKR